MDLKRNLNVLGFLRRGGNDVLDVASGLVINPQTGTTYTFVEGDKGLGRLTTLDNAAAIALTIPTNATLALPVGTVLNFAQIGAGQVTVGNTGLTVIASPGRKLRAQGSTATAIKLATNTWLIIGDLAA